MKKQKEEFDETVIKLQERITTLELEKDDLMTSELTMYLSSLRKQWRTFLKRLVNSWGRHLQMYLCLTLTKPIALSLNTSDTEIKRNVAALLFVS